MEQDTEKEQALDRVKEYFRKRILGEVEERTIGGKKVLDDRTIALRAVKELENGMIVQLGYGIPTYCADFIPPDKDITFFSENGILGFGPLIYDHEQGDENLADASGQFVSPKPGMSIFSIEESFAMIRGGHIDVSVIGALQVSEKGDLANWLMPGKRIGSLGGAMDMAYGAKKLIVTMPHVTLEGEPKIVKELTCEPTAFGCVDLIITDIAVIEVTGKGLVLKEVAPGWTPEEVQKFTEPKLLLAPDLKEIELL